MSKTRRRTTSAGKASASSPISPLMIGLVVGAAILIVGGLIALGFMNNQPTANVDLGLFPSKGKANAPVTMVGYSDYRCPHCRDFEIDKLPQIEKEYIDTGKVRFVVAPFHLWPETAVLTEAALCAGDQGKFFEYAHILFENQDTTVPNPSNLADLAGGQGLNRETFAQCLSNGTHRTIVDDATRAALNRGVTSTPTFFINNQRVDGNVPYEEFKRIFDQELAKVQQ